MNNPHPGQGAAVRPGGMPPVPGSQPPPEQRIYLAFQKNRESHKGAFLTDDEKRALREELSKKFKNRSELETELNRIEQENQRFKEDFLKAMTALKTKFLPIVEWLKSHNQAQKDNDKNMPPDKIQRIENEIKFFEKLSKFLKDDASAALSPHGTKYIKDKVYPSLKKCEQTYMQRKTASVNPNPSTAAGATATPPNAITVGSNDVKQTMPPTATHTPVVTASSASASAIFNSIAPAVPSPAETKPISEEPAIKPTVSPAPTQQTQNVYKPFKRERTADELHDDKFRSKWKIVENLEKCMKVSPIPSGNDKAQGNNQVKDISVAQFKESLKIRSALGW